MTENFYNGAVFDTPNRELPASSDRWLSVDPAGAGWNGYAYPANPNSKVDPSGLAYMDINGTITGWNPFEMMGTGGGLVGFYGSNGFLYVGTEGAVLGDYTGTSNGAPYNISLAVSANGLVWVNNFNGEEVSQAGAQELGLSMPSFVSRLEDIEASPVFLAGCSGPGIPCALVKTQYQPPPDMINAYRKFNYKVIDIEGSLIENAESTEYLEALSDGETTFYPGPLKGEEGQFSDKVGWNGPIESAPNLAFVAAQTVSVQIGGQGPDYLLNVIILHGASVGNGIFSAFSNATFGTLYSFKP